jgi:hypothetical protein
MSNAGMTDEGEIRRGIERADFVRKGMFSVLILGEGRGWWFGWGNRDWSFVSVGFLLLGFCFWEYRAGEFSGMAGRREGWREEGGIGGFIISWLWGWKFGMAANLYGMGREGKKQE